MRHLLACLALLAVAASPRSGCGGDPPRYAPCAAKACGATCTVCAPDDPSCSETAVLKACDPSGACVAAGTFTCPGAGADCAGKACGEECTIDPPCRSATPPCMMPSVLGHCDGAGRCTPAMPLCSAEACLGKPCGAACNPCGDANPCPTFAATACDPRGECVTAGTFSCLADPCVGKACGESCSPCAPGVPCPAILCVTACDGAGRCTCSGGGVACP